MASVEWTERWDAEDDPRLKGKIEIKFSDVRGYNCDGYTELEELIELRAAIDKFLFLELHKRSEGE